MVLTAPEGPKLARSEKVWISASRGAAVLLGAFFLAWPAFYNGFPLLYPDSVTYLGEGDRVARAIFLHQFSLYYGMRSFFYSLGILPWHWNISPWPIVALQCLLVAFVLWLVVRSVVPRNITVHYLILVLLLSLFTSVSWYSTIILPDILGAAAYLSFYLLVFARETLSRIEQVALYLIAWWGITAHATHLMLAAGVCVLLPLMLLLERKPFRRILKSTGEVALLVVLAASAQFALNGYLDGKPSLNGERPPYLMARVIADGPGRWYLEKHCGTLKWAICTHVQNLPANPDDFFWEDGGIWDTASDSEKDQMLREEMPFVLATLRAYPVTQLSRSAGNFWGQMNQFGIHDLDSNSWVKDAFGTVMPSAQSSYEKSRQARDAIPLNFISTVQSWAVLASLGSVIFGLASACLPTALRTILWRRRPIRLIELGVLIVTMVVANGFLTGTLSMPDDRYECRVIWMVPLLAELFVAVWLGQRQTAKLPGGRKQARESVFASI